MTTIESKYCDLGHLFLFFSNLDLLENARASDSGSRDGCVISRASITQNAPASFSLINAAAMLDATEVLCARGKWEIVNEPMLYIKYIYSI